MNQIPPARPPSTPAAQTGAGSRAGNTGPTVTAGRLVALFAILLAFWLLSSGHYTPLIISFGVGSCAFVALLAWRMEIVDDEAVPVHLLGRVILYLPWIAWQVVLANLDVARRVLSPRLPISPKVIDVDTSQQTDLGRVLFANSITLTPGTVSIRVHGSKISVHAIAEEVADDLLAGEMDRRVTRLEGLS